MQKFIVRILCCFIPNKKTRHVFRKCVFGRYKITGNNNIIKYCGVILPKWLKIPGLYISINGNDCFISIGSNTIFQHTSFIIGNDNAKIHIDTGSELHGVFARLSYGVNQSFMVGKHTILYGADIIIDENGGLNIGSYCLFANNINIRASDGHSVLDKTTGKILNHITHPVNVGDKCWIGQGVRILKNAQIPTNTIVGGGSVVTKKFDEEYTVIAGNPAKVIKHDVTWSHMNPMTLERHLNNK